MSTGRPEIPFDWDLIERLLQAECSGVEVASALGVHHDTLYDRVLKDKGIIFSAYSAKLRAKGNSSLRNVQFAKALEGDNTMLVWLGKNRLDQRDKPKDDDTPQDAQISTMLDTIKMLHANVEKIKELEEKLKKYESNARVD